MTALVNAGLVDIGAVQATYAERKGLTSPEGLRLSGPEVSARRQDIDARMAELMRPAVEAQAIWKRLTALGYTPAQPPYVWPWRSREAGLSECGRAPREAVTLTLPDSRVWERFFRPMRVQLLRLMSP